MKIQKTVGSLIAAALLSFSAITAHAEAGSYSFKVHNTTQDQIKKLLVSQDGKEWGYFDIGAGIEAGATSTLVWDSSTNNESCDQYFKVEFANGEESQAVKFNFCEENLELEF